MTRLSIHTTHKDSETMNKNLYLIRLLNSLRNARQKNNTQIFANKEYNLRKCPESAF